MIGMSFAGVDLSSGKFTVTETDAFSAPQKATKIIELARRDGSVQVYEKFNSRTIGVSGYIKGDSGLDLRAAMSQLKALLLSPKSSLTLIEDGYPLIWDRTKLRNVNISRDQTQVTYATFSAEFFSEQPFAVDGVSDTWFDQDVTAATNSIPFLVSGTYPGYPIIDITVTAINPNDTETTIVFGNPATSQLLEITRLFKVGDIISIDTLNRRAFIGTELISPDGQFPAWVPGAGTFEISDLATSRTLHVKAVAPRRYL